MRIYSLKELIYLFGFIQRLIGNNSAREIKKCAPL